MGKSTERCIKGSKYYTYRMRFSTKKSRVQLNDFVFNHPITKKDHLVWRKAFFIIPDAEKNEENSDRI